MNWTCWNSRAVFKRYRNKYTLVVYVDLENKNNKPFTWKSSFSRRRRRRKKYQRKYSNIEMLLENCCGAKLIRVWWLLLLLYAVIRNNSKINYYVVGWNWCVWAVVLVGTKFFHSSSNDYTYFRIVDDRFAIFMYRKSKSKLNVNEKT